MPKNGDGFPEFVTKAELITVCEETQDMINGLRIAINTHAEICQLHRWLLEKFIPAPTLTAAVTEYAELRAKGIAEEEAMARAAEGLTSAGAN